MVIDEGEIAAREGTMSSLWVGIDAGKRKHHFVVLDTEAKALLSKAVAIDEADLPETIGTVLMLAGDAADGPTGRSRPAAHLLAGRVIHHAAATYRGDGKTDAKDAHTIANQASIRTDLQPVRDPDRVSVDLRLLTAKRLDLIHDRIRSINRLRATLLEYFPALEAAFDSANQLAGAPGLAPVPRDSGRISGNLHQPRHFDRILLRTCYLAAHSSLKNSPASKPSYHRRRGEGKPHKQALIALARRRTNVVWAILLDRTPH